jgi:hypothetical protein
MPVVGNVNGLAIMHDHSLVDVDELMADAARWRYIRDNHAQGSSPHMDGTMEWRFTPLRWCVGQSPDEVVDKLIRKEYKA